MIAARTVATATVLVKVVFGGKIPGLLLSLARTLQFVFSHQLIQSPWVHLGGRK